LFLLCYHTAQLPGVTFKGPVWLYIEDTGSTGETALTLTFSESWRWRSTSC